ncbi:hypothetical protein ABH917_004056 [Thermobifida halotolerans]
MVGVVPGLGERHLVGAPGVLHLHAVHGLGAGPALGSAHDDHRPAHVLGGAVAVAGAEPDRVDAFQAGVQNSGHLLVDGVRVVTRDHVRFVAVAAHLGQQVVLGDAGQHGRSGDLVAVEVQDRQDRAVAHRVEEAGRLPASGERPGLGLAVADDGGDHQVGVVEGRAEGVGERVAEFAALVDGAGRLRRRVAGHPAGEGELAEQLAHALGVQTDVGIGLGVDAVQPRRGHGRGSAVSGTDDPHHLGAAAADLVVEVRVDEVEAGRGAPVAEQPRLDVLGSERFAQQRVVHQVDLADGQVVRGSPVPVDLLEFGGGERLSGNGLCRGHAVSLWFGGCHLSTTDVGAGPCGPLVARG